MDKEDWSNKNNRIIIYDIKKVLGKYAERKKLEDLLIPTVINHIVLSTKNPPKNPSEVLDEVLLSQYILHIDLYISILIDHAPRNNSPGLLPKVLISTGWTQSQLLLRLQSPHRMKKLKKSNHQVLYYF